MKQKITLTESDLHRIVKESVEKILNEAESDGWFVDSSEADEAYDMAAQEFGSNELNAAIVRCLGDDTLAQCLAFIFRQYDFRQWNDRV